MPQDLVRSLDITPGDLRHGSLVTGVQQRFAATLKGLIAASYQIVASASHH